MAWRRFMPCTSLVGSLVEGILSRYPLFLGGQRWKSDGTLSVGSNVQHWLS